MVPFVVPPVARNKIEHVFGRTRVFLPVIHPASYSSVLRSTEVAREAGADGLFLIDQGMPRGDVFALAKFLRTGQAPLWLGMNLLGETPAQAMSALPSHFDGLWSDNALISTQSESQPAAQAVQGVRRARGWYGLWFGGVAFKYQPPETKTYGEWLALARAAREHVDVVTTSGPGTGMPADPMKLAAFREGLGEAALGLASGITCENVANYLPYVNAFLVASGIETSFGVLDPDRTKRLADLIHG